MLARSMGHLQSRFGAEHNRRWRSSGPLWQSRYKAKLVESEESLPSCQLRARAARSRLRYLVATLAIERWRLNASALATVVGRRPDVVCRWAQRGVELRREDDQFEAAFERLDQELVRTVHEDSLES